MESEYKFSREKIHLVPNGIDEALIEKRVIPHDENEKVTITFIGRMEWYKGVQDLISAADSLRRSDRYKRNNDQEHTALPDFEVKIMGRAGNWTEKLKEQIEKLKADSFIELMFSPDDEIKEKILYEESQISILPSKWEGTGIVLLEAMAKGNAVVSTRQNDALALIIEEGVTGYSYDFGDIDALVEILYKLLSNYELRQSMRKENLKRAKNFTWEGVMPAYLEMIGKVLV